MAQQRSRGPKRQTTGLNQSHSGPGPHAGLGVQLQDAEARVGPRVSESQEEAQKSNTMPYLEIRKHKPGEVKWLTLKSHWHKVVSELRLEPRGLSPALSYFHSLSYITLKIHSQSFCPQC